MKAIQPIAIINPSAPQKIRKFRDRDVTQICDSQVPPASPRSPRWLRHHHARKAGHDVRFKVRWFGTAKRTPVRRRWACKNASLRRAAIVARVARGEAQPPRGAWPPPAFLGPRRLRVKKSLPDRGGCSMINNLPKLMASRLCGGVFRTEILSCFR